VRTTITPTPNAELHTKTTHKQINESHKTHAQNMQMNHAMTNKGSQRAVDTPNPKLHPLMLCLATRSNALKAAAVVAAATLGLCRWMKAGLLLAAEQQDPISMIRHGQMPVSGLVTTLVCSNVGFAIGGYLCHHEIT